MAWKWEKPWQEALRSLERLHYVDLEPLGLIPSNVSGMFRNATIPLEYAALNPHLHIVSVFYHDDGRRLVNRYCPEADGFYLAKGVKDPNFEVEEKRMIP